MTTKQAFVTEKLNEFWQAEVAPNVKKNCCILSARITSEVFTYFNIQNKVIPVSAFVCNDEMAERASAPLYHAINGLRPLGALVLDPIGLRISKAPQATSMPI